MKKRQGVMKDPRLQSNIFNDIGLEFCKGLVKLKRMSQP